MSTVTESSDRLRSALDDLVLLARSATGAPIAWIEWVEASGAGVLASAGFEGADGDLTAPLLPQVVPPLGATPAGDDPRLQGTPLAGVGAIFVLPLVDREGVVRGSLGVASPDADPALEGAVLEDGGILKALARQALVAFEYSRLAHEGTARAAHRQRELERSNEELERFASRVSHDLRSPLRAISHLTTWIREDTEDVLSGKSSHHLETLQESVQRMRLLLDSLLDYSCAGGLDESVRPVDVKALVREVAGLLHLPSTFEIAIADDLPVLETAQPPLRQVFLNLIGNAWVHHDREQGRIEVSSRTRAGHVEFRVCDDGPGIATEDRERVFEMFQTLAPRTSESGSGMGLAMVRRLVESWGGEVRIEPVGERGLCVCFTWPDRG